MPAWKMPAPPTTAGRLIAAADCRTAAQKAILENKTAVTNQKRIRMRGP
ncbi:MAG: hypothetical protein HY897_06210 [Deltaproteobacteria bacterium]|nr:hypothetical protein [Deltaproteobacteria bacterium]